MPEVWKIRYIFIFVKSLTEVWQKWICFVLKYWIFATLLQKVRTATRVLGNCLLQWTAWNLNLYFWWKLEMKTAQFSYLCLCELLESAEHPPFQDLHCHIWQFQVKHCGSQSLTNTHTWIWNYKTDKSYDCVRYMWYLFLHVCLSASFAYILCVCFYRAMLRRGQVTLARHLSVRAVKVSWSHRLEYFENNFLAY